MGGYDRENIRRECRPMSISESQFLKLGAEINEAALAPDRWLNVIQMLASCTESIAGGVTIEDPVSGAGDPITYFGFDPDHVKRTWHHFLPMNPLFKIAPMMRPGAIVTNGMVIDATKFKKTEFYNGWAKPQGICCPITVVLHRSGTAYVPLTLVRPDGAGDADDDVQELLRRVAPALLQAFSITARLERLKSREVALEEALASLASGIVLLDRTRHVVFMNKTAERIVRDGRFVTTKSGILRAAGDHDGSLQAALSAALNEAPPARASEVLLVAEGLHPILLSVLPVNLENRLFTDRLSVGCLIILSVAQQQTATSATRIAKAYGLTTAEGRLLEALLAGNDLGEAARSLAITRNTAATHLRHIFLKTEVNRQSDLVRLAWSMASAVSPQDA
jgi:DNA-binding CsgD family transcriptional regulator